MRGLRLRRLLSRPGAISEKTPNILLSRKLLDEHAQGMTGQGLAEQVADATGKLVAMEIELERVSIELPARALHRRGRRAAGAAVQIPEENWGTRWDGIRAAAISEHTTFAVEQAEMVYIALLRLISDLALGKGNGRCARLRRVKLLIIDD